MGRRERRAELKAQKIQNQADYLWNERRKRNAEQAIIDTALEEMHDATVHQCTGELYTMMALTLRRHPYRWSPAKVMRFMEKVQGGIIALNDKSWTVNQMVDVAEEWGIRVQWGVEKNRQYIEQIGIFEEDLTDAEG